MGELLAPWVLITLAAAFAQNLRSLLQRRLAQSLSVQGAAYARFIYGLPIAWLIVWALPIFTGSSQPNASFAATATLGEWLATHWQFLGYATLGGVAQIVGTVALVLAVSRGNFALGTALSKTEAAQAAVFGLVILGDSVNLALASGIGLSFVGVCLLMRGGLSSEGSNGGTGFSGPDRLPLLAGIAAGTGFAVSAVCFRGASLSLDAGSVVERAAFTLAITLSLQTVIQGLYIAWRESDQLKAVLKAWPVAAGVGVIGAFASLGWFTAMSMESAARVRALGQVEILFTLISSRWLLGERLRWLEVVGVGLIVAGLVLLL